jgi:hypothetical protein
MQADKQRRTYKIMTLHITGNWKSTDIQMLKAEQMDASRAMQSVKTSCIYKTKLMTQPDVSSIYFFEVFRLNSSSLLLT